MKIRFDVYFKEKLGTLFKSNEFVSHGIKANTNINLQDVESMKICYLVDDMYLEDDISILDEEKRLIEIPFKSEVLKSGNHEFEIKAYMKDGCEKVSQTYIYNVQKGLFEVFNAVYGHLHQNKSVLDSITSEDIKNWNEKATKEFVKEQVKNVTSIPGATGPKGEKGDTGEVGPQGPQGPQGERGLQGPTGAKGEQGEQGPQGIQGPKGDKGEQGPIGLTGPQGPQGLKGDTGEQGPRGLQGEVGPQGPKGADGLTTSISVNGQVYNHSNGRITLPDLATENFVTTKIAEAQLGGGNSNIDLSGYATKNEMQTAISQIELTPGPKGDKGDTGEQGPRGLQGEKGEVGPQGPVGPQGATGERGPKGDTGEQGPQGEIGPQGPKGDKGEQGATGITPRISVGTVTTLSAGAKATVTKSGTDEEPVFNFGIPKGFDGTGEGGNNVIFRDVQEGEIFDVLDDNDTNVQPPNEPQPQPPVVNVSSISIDKRSHTMKVDEIIKLNITILPTNATNKAVIWESNNSNCTVSNGLVTAKQQGQSIITVRSLDGNKTDTCTITVEAKEIELPPTETPTPTPPPNDGELTVSVRDGLTHMYDFTKLTTESTNAPDLIGNSNITFGNEFAGDGCLIYKNKHLNCGNLLDDNFTVFAHIKYSKGNYNFYCGDRTIRNDGTKIGASSKPFDSFALRDNQYYVLCAKYNLATKTMYAYVDGELISEHQHSNTISDKSIYLSFAGNDNENGKNYNLLVYNKLLEDNQIKTISQEIRVRDIKTDNITNISIKENLKEYYDFNNTSGNENKFNSLIGDNSLLVNGSITGNNGLILGTSSQNLTSQYKIPVNQTFTYFLKSTIPSTSVKGNKVIELDNLSLYISKTSCYLRINSTSTTTFTPIIGEQNVFAFTVNIKEGIAKIYHDGILKNTINFNGYTEANHQMYMLSNDLIHHNILLYSTVLTDEKIRIISNELRDDNARKLTKKSIKSITKSRIKAINDTYPVTVDKAVYIAGTNKTLEQKLKELEVGGTEYSQFIEKIKEPTNNLLSLDNLTMYGYYDMNNSGAWYEDSNMCSTDYIKIKPSTQYIRSTQTGVLHTFYTKDKRFISGTRNQNFTTPSNAEFIRLAVKINTLETEMLVEGNVLPNQYIPCIPTPVYKLPKQSFEVELTSESVNKEHLSDELKKEILIGDVERFEKALPKVPLHIETYYEGANEPYHPSIMKFDQKWNGYKYWLAYTPFPDEANENPCIAASNDLINWETPNGLTNPIDKPHDYDRGATGYWSDTHLVYNPNTNKLECWYRGIGASGTGENNICRKTSSNGIVWSEREVLFTFTAGSYVSPCIIFEENKYKIWFCRPSEIYESVNGTNWSKVGDYKFIPKNYNLWHQDIIKTDKGYELVGMESVGQNTRLIHFTSKDGIKFEGGTEIVKVLDNNKYGIKGFYKPCIVKENGIYYLFLSINWNNGTNGTSLAISEKIDDITALKGIDQNYVPYMAKYSKKGKSGFEGQVIFDKTLNKMIYCKKGGRNAIWVDFNGNTV